MLARIVADAHGVIANFLPTSLSDLPFPAVSMLRKFHGIGDDLAEFQCRAARSVFFEAVVPFDDLDVDIVRNDLWHSGMSSSLRAGVRAASGFDALLITLCDQPLVTAMDLRILLSAFREGGRSIAAASYGQSLGVPAVFARAVFEELLALTGDRGAKSVILADEDRVTAVTIAAAATDVDSPEDAIRIGADRDGPPDRR